MNLNGMILGVICMKFLKLCQLRQIIYFQKLPLQIKLMRIARLRRLLIPQPWIGNGESLFLLFLDYITDSVIFIVILCIH